MLKGNITHPVLWTWIVLSMFKSNLIEKKTGVLRQSSSYTEYETCRYVLDHRISCPGIAK